MYCTFGKEFPTWPLNRDANARVSNQRGVQQLAIVEVVLNGLSHGNGLASLVPHYNSSAVDLGTQGTWRSNHHSLPRREPHTLLVSVSAQLASRHPK